MVAASRDYSVHLVGLGGTGSNILTTLLMHPKIYNFLERGGVKLTMLALDVADHDILQLQKQYNTFSEGLRSRGIPQDKVSFIAKAVKFPTPEAMYDFVIRFPDFLKLEGATIPKDYKPWISSAVEIPPLVGGVGRRRALSKAIYGLNYYYLRLIDIYTESFKENVSSSTLQPIIFIAFGIGGGSGSGMVVDFARHLRQKLGSGFPIVGIGALPCSGDDQWAKGTAASAAMNEFELLLDGSKNAVVRKNFGEVYQNPFTAFLVMPLGPPYRKAGNLSDAHLHFDETVVDILLNTLRFDLSNMLDNIGSNLNLGDKWIHVMTSLRVTYPINEYIELSKLYIDCTSKLRSLRKDMFEVSLGSLAKGTGGIQKLFDSYMGELREIYKVLLIEKGSYDESRFKEDLENYIYNEGLVDLNTKVHIQGSAELIQNMVDQVTKPVKAIGLDASEGTPEALLSKYIQSIIEETRNISNNYDTFHESIYSKIEEMNNNVAGTQKMTFHERTAFEDLMDIVKLVDIHIPLLKKYQEMKIISEKMSAEMSTFEDTMQKQFPQEEKITLQRILELELPLVISILSTTFQVPKDVLATLDKYLNDIRTLKKLLNDVISTAKKEKGDLNSQLKKLEEENISIESELTKYMVRLFKSGRKRELIETLEKNKTQIANLQPKIEQLSTKLSLLESKIVEYIAIERKFELMSDFRKMVKETMDLSNNYYNRMNEITRDRGYYDRVAEITEEERLRIMQKILKEEDTSLTRENILRDIVDRVRFKEYLMGVARTFKIPSTLGVSSSFKTDFLWVTVASPHGVWDPDMDADLKTSISGYISGDASKCITISHLDSEEPWTTRILVLASRAKRTDLDVHGEMQNIYDSSIDSDKKLSHSFLLEQGILASKYVEQLEEND